MGDDGESRRPLQQLLSRCARYCIGIYSYFERTLVFALVFAMRISITGLSPLFLQAFFNVTGIHGKPPHLQPTTPMPTAGGNSIKKSQLRSQIARKSQNRKKIAASVKIANRCDSTLLRPWALGRCGPRSWAAAQGPARGRALRYMFVHLCMYMYMRICICIRLYLYVCI